MSEIVFKIIIKFNFITPKKVKRSFKKFFKGITRREPKFEVVKMVRFFSLK